MMYVKDIYDKIKAVKVHRFYENINFYKKGYSFVKSRRTYEKSTSIYRNEFGWIYCE